MATAEDFMTRNLPSDVDLADESGLYGAEFRKLSFADDDYEWPILLEMYIQGDAAQREIINKVFLTLVGYTLPTIVEFAHSSRSV